MFLQMPEITAGEFYVKRRPRHTETAVENPKNKRKIVNKYFCYRILESGEGSAADTLQFSPTPPQTNLRGGVSHKGA